MLNIKNIKPRTEEEIMSSWANKEKLAVSIVCATYNHEPYIEDAITSFLMQETYFAFEIIIYDDASTDNTANIVREYQAKYPTIIKPIFSQENRYSKGGFKPSPYAASFAKGEFVALCEGDDFWCSAHKLQKQFNVMDQYTDINLCVHSAYSLYRNGSSTIYTKHSKNNKILKSTNFIIGDGGYVVTSSLFIRICVLDNLPDWFYNQTPVGDYYIQMMASYPNGALYLSEPLSVYRRDAENNWSSENLNNLNKVVIVRERLLKANILCEKQFDDPRLFVAFTLANYKHLKLCLTAKYKIAGKLDFTKLFMKLFQFRYLLYPYFRIRQRASNFFTTIKTRY